MWLSIAACYFTSSRDLLEREMVFGVKRVIMISDYN